ncbi:MAG: adenylate/guanylate cyclase domain-containing protein [Spirochaetota bacterium]
MKLRNKFILSFSSVILISTCLMIVGAVLLNKTNFEDSLESRFQVAQDLIHLNLNGLINDWENSLSLTIRNRETTRELLSSLAAPKPIRFNFFKFIYEVAELSKKHSIAQTSIHFISASNPNFQIYSVSNRERIFTFSTQKDKPGDDLVEIGVDTYGLLLPKFNQAQKEEMKLPLSLATKEKSTKLHSQANQLYFDIHFPITNDSLGLKKSQTEGFAYLGLKYGVARSFLELKPEWRKHLESQMNIKFDIHLPDGKHGLGDIDQALTSTELQNKKIYYRTVGNIEYISRIIPIERKGKQLGYIVSSVPQSVLRSQILKTGSVLLIIGIFALGSSIILAIILALYLVRPIKKLEEQTRLFAQGNLQQEIETGGKDELGSLAKSFAFMGDEIRKKVGELKNSNEELEDARELLKKQNLVLQQTNESIQRFVPNDFLVHMNKSSILDVNLGDCSQKHMAILFSDLRSFTSLSENMTPEENFNFLNSLFNQVVPAIRNNEGFIDKYIGDAVMALFSGSSDNAIRAGIDMLKQLEEYNLVRQGNKIRMGVGIHNGHMMLGTIGEKERIETTVISDTVNLASRLESMTKAYGVSMLISEDLYKSLNSKDTFAIRTIDRVLAKGKKEPVSILEVYDADQPEIYELKSRIRDDFEKAVSLYQTRKFKRALKLFHKCLEQFPSDTPSELYIQRCQYFIQNGCKKDWDGVTSFNHIGT